MPDRDKCTRPKSTLHQQFRSSFLCIIEPEDRKVVEAFGDLIEASLIESHYARDDDTPVNVRDSRAALEDLDAVLLHFRDTIGTWDSSRGETSERLRVVAFQTLGLLEQAASVLRDGLDAESEPGAEAT